MGNSTVTWEVVDLERSDLEDALEAKLSEGRLCKPKHVDDPSYIGQSAHGMQSIHACT